MNKQIINKKIEKIYSSAKIVLLLTMSTIEVNKSWLKLKQIKSFQQIFATTYHMRVITLSEKLFSGNMVSYKVAVADNILIYNFDKNKMVNTRFILYKQSDFQDQTLSC